MATIEEHKSILKELLDDINEKIRADLLKERQKIIGFAASEASAHLFALLLHKNNLISPGYNVNHKFFSSAKKAENRFEFEFPQKDKILNLLVKQEDFRDKLCYGRDKDKTTVSSAITNLFELKQTIEEIIGDVL